MLEKKPRFLLSWGCHRKQAPKAYLPV